VETKSIVAINLGFETTRRARSQMVWNLSGAVCWRMETSLSGVRRCAHTGLNPVACYVSFETRAFEIYATLPAGPRTYLPDDTVQFVSLTHIVGEPRSWRTIITGWLVDHTHYHAPWLQFPPWSSHSPVCTITAVSKDLVRRPTRISYDLSLATLSHELGCLLADSGTIRREVTRPVAGRPSMFVLRSMRKHPRDFGGRFGKS